MLVTHEDAKTLHQAWLVGEVVSLTMIIDVGGLTVNEALDYAGWWERKEGCDEAAVVLDEEDCPRAVEVNFTK